MSWNCDFKSAVIRGSARSAVCSKLWRGVPAAFAVLLTDRSSLKWHHRHHRVIVLVADFYLCQIPGQENVIAG